MKINNKISIILTSGGLDSATVAAMARQQGYELNCLSFDYGQRHRFELEAARKVAAKMGARRHLVLSMDMGSIGGSCLTDMQMEVPKQGPRADRIPSTYVPARNTIFLSYALAWAEVIGAAHIFIGANCVDYSGYPDCRPAYLEAFEKMANLATKAAVEGRLHIKLHAPLLKMTKAEIIRTGVSLGVDYSITHSCYDPDERGLACGRCDSCVLRHAGFVQAGLPDPTRYQENQAP